MTDNLDLKKVALNLSEMVHDRDNINNKIQANEYYNLIKSSICFNNKEEFITLLVELLVYKSETTINLDSYDSLVCLAIDFLENETLL